jgi:hypothetical protein
VFCISACDSDVSRPRFPEQRVQIILLFETSTFEMTLESRKIGGTAGQNDKV